MATTTPAHVPTSAAQSAALINFLNHQAHTLSSGRANELCEVLSLHAKYDFKELAKRLRAELFKDGIKLGQAHALEALSHMAGFSSYMRLREGLKQQTGEFTREGFLVRVRVTGEEDGQFKPYDSLPAAANVIVEQVMARLNIPREPVYCELRRSSKSIVIEACRAQGAWFAVELVAYVLEEGNVNFVDMDADSQRTCLERLVRAIEHGRPGALATYGVIPKRLSPWHYALFQLTFADTGVQKIATDEQNLFFMFDGLEAHTAEVVGGTAWVVGTAGKASVKLSWQRVDAANPSFEELVTPQLAAQLVERYRLWRRGLGVPIKDAIVQLASGSSDATGKCSLNIELLAARREQLQLGTADLATSVGISIQEMQRIEKFGFVAEKLVPALAKAVDIDANELVTQSGGELGFEVDEAQHLVSMLKDVHAYNVTIPEEFDEETVDFLNPFGESLKELGDLVQMHQGVFSDAMKDVEPIREDDLLEYARDLLEELHAKHLTLIVARGIRFGRKVGDVAWMEGMPIHVITFWFQRKTGHATMRIDNATVRS